MPFHKRSRTLARLVVAGASLAVFAMPGGAAAADCTLPATTQTFAQFGDPSYYFLATGGDFETDNTRLGAWYRSADATLASENEPFALTSASHTKSVRLAAGGETRSGRFCVTAELPHLRFVARSIGLADLNVRVDTYDGKKLVGSAYTTIGAATHATWAPSPFVDLNTSGIPAGEKLHAQVTISSSGDWLVDGVYVDPYAK